MKKYLNRIKNKHLSGSLSLEAVIAFTVFISFMFLLLSIVKFSLVRITLNTATTETAKQITTSAYPMSYLIEYQNSEGEEIDAYEEEMSLTEGLSNEQISDSISTLFNVDEQETSNVVDTITKAKDILSGGDNAQAATGSLVRGLITQLEGKATAYIACKIFDNYIEKSIIPFDKNDVTLSIVKFPQSTYAYNQTGNSEGYKKLGLANEDYTEEDVIIAVEYDYDFALPFLPSFNIIMREVVVEHAWLYGGGGIITDRTDGNVFEDFESVVFGANKVYLGAKLTGKKYHKKDCPTLYKGAIVMNKQAAINDGYSPCKKCNP